MANEKQSIDGTCEAACAHLLGLVKMFTVRGGYWSFESQNVVIRVLAW